MKYLCVHCDKTFEHKGEKKPRCPECMRVNGLEPVAQAKAKAPTRPAWVLPTVVGGALLAAGLGYAWWAGQAADTVTGDVPLAPLDRAAILGHLRHHGVDARQLNTYLVPDEATETWAERAAGDASGPQAKAAAILQAIRARAAAGAFERWSFGIPRDTPIAPPSEILTRLREDDSHNHLYPLEAASLMVTALRSQDVPAMVAEAIRFPGDRAPPDPTGQLGYYVVAVYPGDAGEGEPHYYDPYLGRDVPPDETRVLDDVQVVAAALSHRALHLLSRESDPERAMEASQQAVRLDGRSPENRGVRGAILLAAGQAEEGLDELVSARQLRTDAPRRNLLAGVYMAQGDLDSASREVAAALEEYPDFASGHATLAAIHLARQETGLAHAELEDAERLDPDLHLLPQLWAGYFATIGDMPQAVERARLSVQRNPDIQTRLMAARIYRAASRYDLMRREAHAVLDRTPSARQPEMREVIQRMLGSTALEPLEDDEVEAEGAPIGDLGGLGGGSEPLDLDLGGGGEPGQLQLGGGGGGPSLLGGERLGSPGLQLGSGGGGGQLQLGGGGGAGGGGSGLRLDLGDGE